MEELFKERIITIYNNYNDLKTIVEQKQKELEESKKKIQEIAGNSIEEKVEFYQNFYIDLMLMITDSKIIFNKLFILIDLYKVLCKESLPEEIINFYDKNRHFYQSELFIMKDGNVLEKEKGSLQKQREAFLKSDFLSKLIEKTNV